MVKCVNLKDRFGDRFKVEYEESYYTERTIKSKVEPWLMIIPCRRKGWHFFPWDSDRLAISTMGQRGKATSELLNLPYSEVVQDGSDGRTITFPVDKFDEVAKIAKPRTKRRMTPEQRAAATERLLAYRLKHAQSDSKIDLESPDAVEGDD